MEQAQKQEPEATGEKATTDGKRSFWQRRPVIVIGTVVLFWLLFCGLRYLAESLTHEWTDDAFLDSTIVSIAPKVAGQVKQSPGALGYVRKVKPNDPIKVLHVE